MSIDDDEIWLDALAGRVAHAESSVGLHEGHVLRALILARDVEVAPAIAARDPAREASLIEHARVQGLLTVQPIAPRVRGFAPSYWSRVARAAAALAVVALAAGVAHFAFSPTETLRGMQGGVVVLEAQDPRALKRELIEELQAVGVRAAGYERLNRVGVDADLPEPIAPNVRQVLERHHVPVPADGALVIEIDSPGNR
jgi:hypothetical protein